MSERVASWVLRFKNDDIGYIHFKKADRWHAQYTSSLLFVTNNCISYRSAVTNGLVRLGREIPRVVLCGDIIVANRILRSRLGNIKI